MTWAEKRIHAYREGQPATFIERLILSFTHPIALLLAMIGLLMLIGGLWLHAWPWIGAGVAVYLLGLGYGYFRGWPDRKLESYRCGGQAGWLDQRILEHAHPLHLVFAAAGFIMIIFGLWVHGWLWIVAGILLNFAGHVYTWLIK
ncbi:hypothetical protein [Nitrosomonas sp. ANs5]|uniref:hypothetical protein n=1 Tax=Nitrosomonas sp. ANs5 TaxID=3423941 RepID=UPI003D32A232